MRAYAVLALSLVALTSACSKSPGPQEFLTKAIQGDNSEIRLGALATAKGGSAVQAYGRTLVADHTKARADALPLARKYGVQPPEDMIPAAQKEQAKLVKLNGTEFDKEFVSYMVKDHKEDISDFQKEADSKASEDVRALARSTVPHLQMHLDLAKRLT